MLHWGTAAFTRWVALTLVALLTVALVVVDARIKARRRERGRERRLWFEYATRAAQTAREMRGEML